MAIEITHKKVSLVQDGEDEDLIQPSDWNETHDITLSANKVIGRTTGDGAAEEITFTAAARNLADDEDAETMRQTLGLKIGEDVQPYDADTAKTDTPQDWNAPQSPGALPIESSTAWVASKQLILIEVDGGEFDVVDPTGIRPNTLYAFRIDFKTSHTVNWGSAFGGNIDETSDTAGKVDWVYFMSNPAGDGFEYQGCSLDAAA